MNLFHLRHVNWIDSQLIYHAMPRVNVEGLNILAPNSPYVCIGYHQNLEQEVDLDFCKHNNIPVFRREVGGGAVFLDGMQIFYQLVIHKNHPLAGGSKADFYQRLLQPVVDTYQELGIPTKYRPVNDVVTLEGRKIAGTGVAEIGDYLILVGNLIADFDYQMMTRVLRVPDEKYRDKVFKSMTENLTTIKREKGSVPTWDEMAVPLIHNFEKVLGQLEPAVLPQTVTLKMEEIKTMFMSDEWLFMKRRKSEQRTVKIATDVNVVQHVYKAPGGLMKADYELKGNVISNLSLSGDYFCYPPNVDSDLGRRLDGKPLDSVQNVVADFYNKKDLETPGITPEDWVKVICG